MATSFTKILAPQWLPIDKDTPLGVQVLACNQFTGVATKTVLGANEKYFTHWCPLPKFHTQ